MAPPLIKSVFWDTQEGNDYDPFDLLSALAEEGTPPLPHEFRPMVLGQTFPSKLLPLALSMYVRCGDTYLLSSLLRSDRIDPGVGRSKVIVLVARGLHLPSIKLLVNDPRVDPSAYGNHLFRRASESGRADIVQFLKDHLQIGDEAKTGCLELRGPGKAPQDD